MTSSAASDAAAGAAAGVGGVSSAGCGCSGCVSIPSPRAAGCCFSLLTNVNAAENSLQLKCACIFAASDCGVCVNHLPNVAFCPKLPAFSYGKAGIND